MFFKFLLVLYYYGFFWYYRRENLAYYHIEVVEFPPTREEKYQHEERVYAIDFDNTIAFTKYPKIIKPIPYAVKVLRILSEDPNSTLILWTCREKEDLQDALNFCELHGIKFDYINENCERNLKLFQNDCRKISADVYIDDHSYEGIEGVEKLWKDWYFWMKEKGIA